MTWSKPFVVNPIEYPDLNDRIPVFLIWPISGASRWQPQVITKVSGLLDASERNKVAFINPEGRNWNKKIYTEWFDYTQIGERQRDWEITFIEQSYQRWLFTAWLDKQNYPLGRDEAWMQEKSYARTTWVEVWTTIWKIKGMSEYDEPAAREFADRVIIWIDQGFTERKTIIKDIERDIFPFQQNPFISSNIGDFSVSISEKLRTILSSTI